MEYLKALQTLLEGMANDNALFITSGCQQLLALTDETPISEFERVLAAHLTKRAVDGATRCPVHELTLIDGYCPSLTCRFSPPRN